MVNNITPHKLSEYKRLKKLYDLDLDYNSLQEEFEDLLALAAGIAGTEFSLLNLIDNHTQWTISSHGLELEHMQREDSICYHTIQSPEPLEINRLDQDERFMDRDFVKGKGLKYYLGIPLTTETGENLGALCVVDKQGKPLSRETISSLKLISGEIMKRLEMNRQINYLELEVEQNKKLKNQLAHDIRSPLSGIIGLCESVTASDEENSMEELTSYLGMINNSGNRIMDLTREILDQKEEKVQEDLEYNVEIFQNKLEELFRLPAVQKNIDLQFDFKPEFADVRFSKSILLSATGNIISNAIKFTPAGGKIMVSTAVTETPEHGRSLLVTVQDSGPGISSAVMAEINKNGHGISYGTEGEKGYGMGLQLVKEMIISRNGQLIFETPETGSRIRLEFPI